MIKIGYFLVSLALLLAVSCAKEKESPRQKDELKNNFLSHGDVGVYGASGIICSYDEEKDQLISYSDGSLFMMTASGQSQSFSISFSDSLDEETTVRATVESVGLKNIPVGSCDLDVLQVTGEKIWLWDDAQETGFIILMAE